MSADRVICAPNEVTVLLFVNNDIEVRIDGKTVLLIRKPKFAAFDTPRDYNIVVGREELYRRTMAAPD